MIGRGRRHPARGIPFAVSWSRGRHAYRAPATCVFGDVCQALVRPPSTPMMIGRRRRHPASGIPLSSTLEFNPCVPTAVQQTTKGSPIDPATSGAEPAINVGEADHIEAPVGVCCAARRHPCAKRWRRHAPKTRRTISSPLGSSRPSFQNQNKSMTSNASQNSLLHLEEDRKKAQARPQSRPRIVGRVYWAWARSSSSPPYRYT